MVTNRAEYVPEAIWSGIIISLTIFESLQNIWHHWLLFQVIIHELSSYLEQCGIGDITPATSSHRSTSQPGQCYRGLDWPQLQVGDITQCWQHHRTSHWHLWCIWIYWSQLLTSASLHGDDNVWWLQTLWLLLVGFQPVPVWVWVSQVWVWVGLCQHKRCAVQ